jgi:two-component system CheB/CheR fusion protein
MKSELSGAGDVQGLDASCAGQLQRAAAATQTIAIIITAEEGVITFWNAGAQRMFGYKADEMIGCPISVLAEPGGQPLQMDKHVSDTLTAVRPEGWYRQKHGGLVYGIGTRVSIDPPNEGNCVWFMRDATLVRNQRLSVEQRLLEQEQAINEVQSANAAKDRFLAMMSHELKQPLTELLLSTELLLQLTSSAESRKLHAIGQTMHGAVRRQARLIDDLLELSRIRTGKLRLQLMPVDISGMVHAACATAALSAPDKQLHVDIQCAGESLCMADPIRVEQILSNLLGNAIKFSYSGGRIDVRMVIDRNHARISVTDTGCGIAAEFLPHVFSMFGQECRRAASANPGLGIGLALVHELATAHGGRVEARSDGSGRGAQFSVWLPLADSASPGRSMTPLNTVTALPAAAVSVPSRCIGVRWATR